MKQNSQINRGALATAVGFSLIGFLMIAVAIGVAAGVI